MAISICVLLYGETTDLAARCLDSILLSCTRLDDRPPGEVIQDIRLCLNTSSSAMFNLATEFTARCNRLGLTVVTVTPRWSTHPTKYPMMRLLFSPLDRENPLPVAEHIMWLDDDAVMLLTNEGWKQLLSHIDSPKGPESADVLGKLMVTDLSDNQIAWILEQPWRNPALRVDRRIVFVQGSWWVVRRDAIVGKWPIPELNHCGGDSLFGVYCQHQNLRMLDIKHSVLGDDVIVNANHNLEENAGPRRGLTEQRLGWDYRGLPLPVAKLPDAYSYFINLDGRCKLNVKPEDTLRPCGSGSASAASGEL